MDAVTICAANYLPFANVLGNSFLEKHPNSNFSILVVDDKKTIYDKKSKFNYLTPQDLAINEKVFENMAFYYNVTELSTALKPSVVKALFSKGSTKVVYLDPDIQVFANFKELDTALNTYPIVLTPHTLNPMPRDGFRPTEADIIGSGTFNLGFIGLSKSETASQMLDWWEERLRFDSISDPQQMLFTDQKWIDFVPSYFSHAIIRDPGYNVAYWNLHERYLTERNETFFADESNLKFFHFSGYRPEKPWILSKYVSDNPRVVISKNSVLRTICTNYSKLTFDQGWNSETHIPYGYSCFESGKKIPASLRRLYREDCINSFKNGEVLNPPNNWEEWATKRSIDSGNLSRVLFSLWKSRPDLKNLYPDATGKQSKNLQVWAQVHGVAEGEIDSELTKIGDFEDDKYPDVFKNKLGLNLSGYLEDESGLGQSARLIYESAKNTGLPVSPLNSSRSKSRKQEKLIEATDPAIYPVIVTVVNADHFEFWVNDVNGSRIKNSRIIGVWAWETEDFPERMHDSFKHVDEIWAVSTFTKAAISKHTKKPIYVFPTPIREFHKIDKLNRELIGITEDQEYNLFIFDYMSVFNRKNPLGLVQAHIEAFPKEDGPLLLIKSTNGDSDAENREKLRFAIQDRTDILLFENYLSRAQMTSLINECSAYISLHRSEGYGLTLAEAMSLGKPVIATGYSGNLDFMNSANSILIPFEKTLVGDNSFPYDSKTMWAEPNIALAAEKIKLLANNQELRQSLGLAAKDFVLTEFNTQRSADFIRNRVSENYSWLRVEIKIRLNKLTQFKVLIRKKISSFFVN